LIGAIQFGGLSHNDRLIQSGKDRDFANAQNSKFRKLLVQFKIQISIQNSPKETKSFALPGL
jgi:phosphatidylethanolamine-binding protein (PEBP) family uncharacterized protein